MLRRSRFTRHLLGPPLPRRKSSVRIRRHSGPNRQRSGRGKLPRTRIKDSFHSEVHLGKNARLIYLAWLSGWLAGQKPAAALKGRPRSGDMIDAISSMSLDSWPEHTEATKTAFSSIPPQLGPYRIEEKLGAGGMGEVYKAIDTRLHRTVAIKVLPHDKFTDPERKARFLQEARAASALNHPNIVTIHDIASDQSVD